MLKSLLPAAMLAFAFAAPASAAAVILPDLPDSPVIQVAGGCGPYGHRDRWGRCRPGGQWGYGGGYGGGYGRGRACPPGYHLGPQGRRCWPNR